MYNQVKRIKFGFKVTGNHTDRFSTSYSASRGGWYPSSGEGGPKPTGPKTGPTHTR